LQVRIALRVAAFNLRGISDEKILDYGLELSGTNLSGGEKQRLAIARGVLGKPTLIVLDEATSALDVETESKILANLDSYLPSHSIKIIVTHRVESLKRANKIIVVNKKRIATYESLSEMKLSMFQTEKK
jgi:ABC-type bacteriocin/lantibiotic exporter with double-glycine peptidase domain